MLIQKVNISKLNLSAYNPRKDLKPGDGDYEKLKKSMQEFGYVDPIIWNKTTGNVIGGHQRLKVLREMEMADIDCVILELDETKEKALNIALNKISGDWDCDLLMQLLQSLETEGFDVALAGFDQKEMDILFAKQPYEIGEDDFDIEKEIEKESEPILRDGEVWSLGDSRLICGDCTKIDTWENLMMGESADLMVTDPPYNVDYNNTEKYRARVDGKECAHDAILNDKLSDENFFSFLYAFYKNSYDNLKSGGAAYVFHASKESRNFMSAMTNAGFKYSETLIWVKNQIVFGRSDYQWRHEPILYGWKEGAPHYFIPNRALNTLLQDEPLNFDTMKKDEMKELLKQIYTETQTTTIAADKPHVSIEHPTMKPLELIAQFIHNSSHEKDLIIDPFCGSGSTLIAAENLNRKCYAMELSPKYCSVIINRFKTNFPNKLVKQLK